MKIAVLGGGSWGTALAMHLARKKYSVKVWEFFAEQAREMQQKRKCRLLSEVSLPKNIFVSSQMREVILGTDLVLIVVPSDKVCGTIETAKEYLEKQPIVICSKGFGKNLELMTEVVSKVVDNELFCLYGPTHAEEVGKGMFSGIVLAGKSPKLKELQKIFASENLRVESSNDLVGVQVASALKNIVAVFVGVLDGAGLGDNAKAYVMVKGLEEVKEIGLKLGAKAEVFFGLAGIGDMIVTGMSKHSRNRHVGYEVGKGRPLEKVLAEMKMVAEGVTTVKLAVKLQKKLGLKLPLIAGLYGVLFKDKKVEEVLQEI